MDVLLSTYTRNCHPFPSSWLPLCFIIIGHPVEYCNQFPVICGKDFMINSTGKSNRDKNQNKSSSNVHQFFNKTHSRTVLISSTRLFSEIKSKALLIVKIDTSISATSLIFDES